MFRVHISLTLALIVLLSFASQAQDKIILMSGGIIECKVLNTSDVFVEYEYTKNNGKVRKSNVSRYEVFSIIRADGQEQVVYQPDFFEDQGYTEDEMRAYITGEQDAYANHTARLSFWGGVGLGFAAGYLGEANLFLTFGSPMVYSGLHFLPNIKIKRENMTDLDYVFNNDYALGYERVARSKMVLTSLTGSATGSLLGTVTFLVTNKD